MRQMLTGGVQSSHFRAAPRCHIVHLDSSSLDSTKHVIRLVLLPIKEH